MWHVTPALTTWTYTHLDQLFNVEVQPTSWRALWQPWWLKASCLWTWNHMAPCFPSTRALPVSAPSTGSLTISVRQNAADLGDGDATESPDCHPVTHAARYPASYLNERPELSLRSSRPRIHFTLFIYSLSPMFVPLIRWGLSERWAKASGEDLNGGSVSGNKSAGVEG